MVKPSSNRRRTSERRALKHRFFLRSGLHSVIQGFALSAFLGVGGLRLRSQDRRGW
jgi:hypothetical protein